MPSHRDLGLNDAADNVGAFLATLDLHRFGPCFFYETGCVAQGLLGVHVIRAVGHVSHQEGMLYSSTNRTGVVQHVINRD